MNINLFLYVEYSNMHLDEDIYLICLDIGLFSRDYSQKIDVVINTLPFSTLYRESVEKGSFLTYKTVKRYLHNGNLDKYKDEMI